MKTLNKVLIFLRIKKANKIKQIFSPKLLKRIEKLHKENVNLKNQYSYEV